MFNRRRALIPGVVIAIVGLCPPAYSALSNHPQEPAAKPRPARQMPASEKQGPDQQTGQQPVAPLLDIAVMQREMQNLSEQIQTLTAEVKRLRRATERNSDTAELLLLEERLARVEDKIDLQQDKKAGLDMRELEAQSRLRNIQQELLLRGGLRRDETEAAIRADVQRSLQDIQSQRTIVQQRLTDLQSQASRLRSRIEELQKKMEKGEEKTQQ